MQITKADGTTEEFSEKKLLTSVHRAGVSEDIKQRVLAHVKAKLYQNIPSTELYHHVSEFLGKSEQPFTRARYTLKQAIMDLGPTGYPFEDYVAKLLQKKGFSTQVRQILQGKCVTHEIDVVAKKEKEQMMVEAKFHNGLGTKTDVQVSLYTKARFDDISHKTPFTKVLLITNTKPTTDAITYAQCAGMDIVGWSYPDGDSLRDMVEKFNLYPITALTTLSQQSKQLLLDQDIVLCEQINQKVLEQHGVFGHNQEETMKEVQFIATKK